MRYLICMLIILGTYAINYADDLQLKKQPLTQEQIRSANEKLKENIDKLSARSDFKKVDSIRSLLKFRDTLDEKCLDQNCYIEKNEFNMMLNQYSFDSINNIDSIRTNILLQLLAQKYIAVQSENIQLQTDEMKNSLTSDDTGIYSYKMQILSSTDSLKLKNTIDAISGKAHLLIKPYEIIINNLHGDDSIVTEMFFRLKNEPSGFAYLKRVFDTTNANQWTNIIRSDAGFYSFFIIGKKRWCPEFNDLRTIIKNAQSNIDTISDTIDNTTEFVYNDSDTLYVKFWSQPPVLSNAGSIIGIDTNRLSCIRVPDCKLPVRIRDIVREKYFSKGNVFFKNIKTDNYIWSLKVENIKTSNNKKSNDMLKNYLIAKRVISVYEQKYTKENEGIAADRKSQYLASLYKKNRESIANVNDTMASLVKAVKTTDLQIQRATLEWMKRNVFFLKNIFFEKYLPKEIVGL